MNFIVLSSSKGTTFQATIEAMKKGELKAKCMGLLTDSSERGCIEKAKKAGIPVSIVERRKGESRENFDRRVDEALRTMSADDQTLLAAMGWMFIFSPWFISAWKNRIINVHPALLPMHGGEGMYGHHVHHSVLTSGDEESGVTIHVMDAGVDTGKILVQKKCSVSSADTAESLQQRVQELEKEWYPRVLQMIEVGEVKLP